MNALRNKFSVDKHPFTLKAYIIYFSFKFSVSFLFLCLQVG